MQLDQVMFEPAAWFALGADNRRLPGVVIVSLADGLARVGRREVAAIVGQLRPGLVVVDVDVDDEVRGSAITDLVTRWAARAQLWTLVRPSGGAPGRHHVFVATGDEQTADRLKAEVASVRASFNVPPRAIDVRRAVRPLSTPHRSGVWAPPYGSPADSLRELRAGRRRGGAPGDVARIGPTSRRRRRRGDAAAAAAACGELRDATGMRYGPAAQRYLGSGPPGEHGRAPSPGRPLTPWQPRARRELPPEWAAYLASATVPTLGGQDHSRTTTEARLTAELLRAGHDAASAWAMIVAADPAAMTRSRVDHRRWIRWVWNRAVWDDVAFHARRGQSVAPSPAPCPPQVLAAIEAARDALTAVALTLPPRRRTAVLLVGHTVLDRMQRRRALRTPVPERDVYVDTGLDRGTVRAVLSLLDGPVGRLHRDTLDRSPTARASTSFEFEIPACDAGVSLIPPPSSHTPDRPPPHPSLWATLPAPSHALWRHLTRHPTPQTAAQLAQQVLTADGAQQASARQVRTAQGGLRGLASAGLAVCDEWGCWTATCGRPPPRVLQAARAQRAERYERAAQERAAYRRGMHSSWATQRAVALARNHAREQAWWSGLPAAERQARTRRWARRFAACSVLEQASVKAALAERRARAGVVEAQRHAEWIAAHPPGEYARRCAARTHWFATLPKPLQQAHVAAWRRHRERFDVPIDLPRSLTGLHAGALPDTRKERDQQFLQTSIPGLTAGASPPRQAAAG